MPTCQDEIALFAAYLADELSPALVTAFEHHLSACSDCAAFLRTYEKTVEITRELLQVERPRRGFLSPSFATRAASDVISTASNGMKPST
jgi:hypothetical protein